MRPFLKPFLTALAIAALTLLPAIAPSAGAAGDDFSWSGEIASGKTLSIRALRGDIEIRPAGGERVEITARRRGSAADRVEVRTVEEEGGTVVCTVHPHADRCSGSRPGDGKANDRARVDFVVLLPPGTRIVADTETGDIEATGLTGSGELRTIVGNIRAETTDRLDARSVNGDVSVRFGTTLWEGLAKIETVNGNIEVSLPERADTELRADTQTGKFSSSDHRLAESELDRRIPGAKIRSTLGHGGRTLEVGSTNGSIRLLSSEG